MLAPEPSDERAYLEVAFLMASFVLRDLPPWWNEVVEKAKADGGLPRVILQLLDAYRRSSTLKAIRFAVSNVTLPCDDEVGVEVHSFRFTRGDVGTFPCHCRRYSAVTDEDGLIEYRRQ